MKGLKKTIVINLLTIIAVSCSPYTYKGYPKYSYHYKCIKGCSSNKDSFVMDNRVFNVGDTVELQTGGKVIVVKVSITQELMKSMAKGY